MRSRRLTTHIEARTAYCKCPALPCGGRAPIADDCIEHNFLSVLGRYNIPAHVHVEAVPTVEEGLGRFILSWWARDHPRVTWTQIVDRAPSTKDRNIATARIVVFWGLREMTDLSFPKIAAVLERSDHTTAVHAWNRGNQLREELKLDDLMRHFKENWRQP